MDRKGEELEKRTPVPSGYLNESERGLKKSARPCLGGNELRGMTEADKAAYRSHTAEQRGAMHSGSLSPALPPTPWCTDTQWPHIHASTCKCECPFVIVLTPSISLNKVDMKDTEGNI